MASQDRGPEPLPAAESEMVTGETERFYSMSSSLLTSVCFGGGTGGMGWGRWRLALLGPGILAMQTAGCFAAFAACPLGDPEVEMGQEVTGLLADESEGLVSFLARLMDLVEVHLPSVRDGSKASLFLEGGSWCLCSEILLFSSIIQCNVFFSPKMQV